MTKTRLRPIETSDLENIMSWVNDPDVVGKFSDLNKPKTREQEAAFLEHIVSSDTDALYAVETESGDYVGNIGLHQIDRAKGSGRLAIIIGNKEYWGQGMAQSAIPTLLNYAFEEHGLHKVWAVHLEGNDKMHHILESCGFQEEGLLRDEYKRDGEYFNMKRMSILEHEIKEHKRIADGGTDYAKLLVENPRAAYFG